MRRCTYNDKNVDDAIGGVAIILTDKPGRDAHDDDGRDPDEEVGRHEDGRHPAPAVHGSPVTRGPDGHFAGGGWWMLNGVCKC